MKTQGRLRRRRQAPVPACQGAAAAHATRYAGWEYSKKECSRLECSAVLQHAARGMHAVVGPFWAAASHAQPECGRLAAGEARGRARAVYGGSRQLHVETEEVPGPSRRRAQRAPAIAAAAAAPPIIACWCCAAAAGCAAAAAAAAWLACMAMARPLARFWSRYSLVPSRTRTPFCSNSRMVSCEGTRGREVQCVRQVTGH